jgi:hypothetical protein
MWVRIGIAALLVGGAVLFALGEIKPDAGPAVIALVLMAGVVLAAPTDALRQLLGKVRSVKIAGVLSAELIDDVQELAKSAPNEETEAAADRRSGLEDAKGNEATDLRLRLEAKLAYVAKHMLEPHTDFVTIGSLHYDKYLTDKEARTADGLLTLRDEDLKALSKKPRDDFVASARDLVKSFRASVLHGWVRATVDRLDGWCVTDLPRGRRPRCDFLVTDGEKTFLVATAFATSSDSGVLNSAVEHLSTRRAPRKVEKRIVVIPRVTDTPTTAIDAEPAVIHMQDLPAALGVLG